MGGDKWGGSKGGNNGSGVVVPPPGQSNAPPDMNFDMNFDMSFNMNFTDLSLPPLGMPPLELPFDMNLFNGGMLGDGQKRDISEVDGGDNPQPVKWLKMSEDTPAGVAKSSSPAGPPMSDQPQSHADAAIAMVEQIVLDGGQDTQAQVGEA